MQFLTDILTLVDPSVMAAGIPDPKPTPPPGSEGLLVVLGWLKWIMVAVAFGSLVVGAMRVMTAVNNGTGVAAKAIALPVIGLIIGASAALILNFFV